MRSAPARAWTHGLVETSRTRHREWPLEPPAPCDAGGWQALPPTLTLSTAGEPQVACDAAYVAKPPTQYSCGQDDWRVLRSPSGGRAWAAWLALTHQPAEVWIAEGAPGRSKRWLA